MASLSLVFYAMIAFSDGAEDSERAMVYVFAVSIFALSIYSLSQPKKSIGFAITAIIVSLVACGGISSEASNNSLKNNVNNSSVVTQKDF